MKVCVVGGGGREHALASTLRRTAEVVVSGGNPGIEGSTPAPPGEIDADLFVIVSATTSAEKAAVRKVSDRFFPILDDGLRHNLRADQEIAKAQRRIAAAKANGKKGGDPKKFKPNGEPNE